MSKKTKSGNSVSENILDLMYKLRSKNMLMAFQKDLSRSERGKGAYKRMFDVYNSYIMEGRPVEEIPADSIIEKEMSTITTSFIDLKQDYYLRMLDFLARTVELKEDEWHQKCLKILKEVDALWALDFKEHAEIRMIDIYNLYRKATINPRNREHNYVVSKIYYYAFMFNWFSNRTKQKQTHKEFLEGEDMQLIADIENWPIRYIDSRKIEARGWNFEQASMRFYQVLYILAKQRKSKDEANEFLRNIFNDYNSMSFKLGYKRGGTNRLLSSFIAIEEREFPHEINYAVYFYLKAEQFYTQLQYGDEWSANETLNELYSLMNKTLKKSRYFMVGLILFLQNNLEKMRYALIRNAKDFEKLSQEVSNDFHFTAKEVELLPLRIELNQLTYQFISSPETTDYDILLDEIKAIEKKTRGIAPINYELEILKLLVWIENNKGDLEQRVIAIRYNADRMKRAKDKFMDLFLSEIQDIEHTHRQKQRDGLAHLHKQLTKLAQLRNPLHNLLLFWLRQFTDDSNSDTESL